MNFNKDFFKGMIAGFLLSLFAIYSFFRIYWIMAIGLKFFRWHAILWLYAFIALMLSSIGYWLFKKGKLKNPRTQKTALTILGIFIGIYLSESYLRLKGEGRMYSEEREGIFINPAERTEKTWYIKWPPHVSRASMFSNEYAYDRITNSDGYSDREWTQKKDSNEIRIMTLGDSFTEGDGCAFDSTYPNALGRVLQARFPELKINVMNAARRGSDPWFEYKKLHDILLPYQPDIVLYTNGSNDMFFDHLTYGGMERFLPDSTVKNRIPEHSWLGLYEVSYVFRLIMKAIGYDHTFFSKADREKNSREAIVDARQLSHTYSQLAVENHFICIQLLRPDKNEMITGQYIFNVDSLLRGTDTLAQYMTFDLLAYYRDSLHIRGSDVDAYFWKIDQHHNAKGYATMGRAIATCVEKIIAVKRPVTLPQ